MRVLLVIAILMGSAEAARLEINAFDQEKLAQFLNRLPENIVQRSVEETEGVRTITNIYPEKEGPFQITCVSPYYDGSPYPSTPECEVLFDDNDPGIDKKYDEWRIKENNPQIVSALFAAIAPRGDIRYYRSGYSDEGTNYEGRRTIIFHYLFQCTATECLYRFSDKVIR